MNIHVVAGHHRRISSLSADGLLAYSSSDEDMVSLEDNILEPVEMAGPMVHILASSSPEIRQLCKHPRVPIGERMQQASEGGRQLPESLEIQDWGFGARPTQRVAYSYRRQQPCQDFQSSYAVKDVDNAANSPTSVKRVSLSPQVDDLTLNLGHCSLRQAARPTKHRRRSCDALPSVQEILSSPQRTPPPSPPRRNSHRRNTAVLS